MRLGYASHIHRAQGATVTRTIVVTGSWQASRETAYVEASRARQGTDWYVSRADLGEDGQDADRITRLARALSKSRAQTPSLAHRRDEPAAIDHPLYEILHPGPLGYFHRLAGRTIQPPAVDLGPRRSCEEPSIER